MSDSKRKAPFTSYEKELLREIASSYLNIIECKKTDATYNKNKLEAWIAIAAKFNESALCQEATHQQLKKLWLNMKTRARDVKTAARQRMHTGGGPYTEPPVEDDLLGDMVSNIKVLPTIKVIQDSDGWGDIDGDDDEPSWGKKRKTSPEPILTPPPRKWSRSPQQIIPSSSVTPRQLLTPKHKKASQLSLMSTSSKAKNDRKPKTQTITAASSIDQLKIKLYEEDIMRREQRFQMESAHLGKLEGMKLKLLKLEYAHKKRLYKMIEEEQALKLKKAKEYFNLNNNI